MLTEDLPVYKSMYSLLRKLIFAKAMFDKAGGTRVERVLSSITPQCPRRKSEATDPRALWGLVSPHHRNHGMVA